MVINFMKQDMQLGGFVLSFWDIVVFIVIGGTGAWMISNILSGD